MSGAKTEYDTDRAIEAMDRLIASYLPAWEGGAAVVAKEAIKSLQSENAKLLRDALRYQWLRSRNIDEISQGGIFAGQTPENVVINGDDLDQVIDEALSNQISGYIPVVTGNKSPPPGDE